VIYIKEIFFFIIISFLLTINGNTKIKDSLFATVGNRAITHSDIINEIKTILILNGQTFSENNKKQLQTAAIKSTIKRNIQQIEIDKYKSLQFNKKDLDMELNRIAKNLNMSLELLENTLTNNEINFTELVNSIKVRLLWNSLIFQLYNERLSINFQEIDEQLKLIENKKEINEYLISEIIIKPVSAEKLESAIKELKDKINTRGFDKVAIDLSISSTAINGGDLGWIDENIISKEFKSKIVNTSVGNISEPIILPNGVLIFKVRDKRKIEKIINLEDAKKQLISAEKTKILNMHSLSHYENLKRSIAINYY